MEGLIPRMIIAAIAFMLLIVNTYLNKSNKKDKDK